MGIHDSGGKKSLPLRYYLFIVYPSISSSKLHANISLKCLSNDLRLGAFENDISKSHIK
jgi:hypothetical protein